MDEGWIRLHRALLESKVWTLPNSQLRVAITCLLLANWKDGEMMSGGEVVKVLRGSFVTSRQSLAEHANVSERTIRTSLANLEKAGFLTRTSTSRFTLISITNYESYQDAEATTDQTSDQPPTSHRPATDHDRRREEGKKGRRREAQAPIPDWLTGEKPVKFSAPQLRPKKLTCPPEAYSLADALGASIRTRQPNHLHIGKARWPKTRERWAGTFRLAHQQDGRPWDEMRRVLDWSQASEWWQSNILSASKFRKQYDTLAAQMERPTKKAEPKPGGSEKLVP